MWYNNPVKVTLKHICAWCRAELREEVLDLPEDLVRDGLIVNHGMCEACYKSTSSSGSEPPSEPSPR